MISFFDGNVFVAALAIFALFVFAMVMADDDKSDHVKRPNFIGSMIMGAFILATIYITARVLYGVGVLIHLSMGIAS